MIARICTVIAANTAIMDFGFWEEQNVLQICITKQRNILS